MTAPLDAALEAAVLARNGRRRGDEIDFLCPAHPNAQVGPAAWNRKRGGWHCASCGEGGSSRDLAVRLGLEVETPKQRAEQARIVATYDYLNEDGSLAYQIVRYEPKEFRQRHRGANGEWVWKSKPHIPYGLRDVLAANPQVVYIPEGEKDCDSIRREGGYALTLPGGAQARPKSRPDVPGKQKWDATKFVPYVTGRTVCLLPDNDTAGADLMQHVANHLFAAGVAVKVLDIPDLPPKGDISDFFLLGGDLKSLERLAEECPLWAPREAVAPTYEEFGAAAYPRTDLGNAELFAALNGSRCRYDHRQGRWLVWNGHYWSAETDGHLTRWAGDAARQRGRDSVNLEGDAAKASFAWAKQSESSGKIKAAIDLAKDLPPLNDLGDWDAAPFLLGNENGIVNLVSGELRPGRPDDRITMSTRQHFDPRAECPLFERIFAEILPDPALREYVRRCLGYAITGTTREQIWWLCYGSGANGKGTLLDTVRNTIGDYGEVMMFQTISRARNESGATPDLAKLQGKRFVTVSEVKGGSAIDEARVKGLTGEDPVSARKLWGNPFTFVPVLHLFVAVNDKPNVHDTSVGFWRRANVVPFEQDFSTRRDNDLKEKLKREAQGILAWLVRGAVDYNRDGLGELPAAMAVATVEYQLEQDNIGQFMTEVCIELAHAHVGAEALYKAYRDWAAVRMLSEREIATATKFGTRMGAKYKRVTMGGRREYRGIGLQVSWAGSTLTLGEGLQIQGEGLDAFPKTFHGNLGKTVREHENGSPTRTPSPTHIEDDAACTCDETHDTELACGGVPYWYDETGNMHCPSCHQPESEQEG